MARVKTSFPSVTLKCFMPNKRKYFQSVRYQNAIPAAVITRGLGDKEGGSQNRVWSPGLAFWRDLGRARQRHPGTSKLVVA